MMQVLLDSRRMPVLLLVLLLNFAGGLQGSNPQIIINEILYHPPLDLEHLQYVELFNRSSSEVNISRWAFTKGIEFTFPEGIKIAGGGYLVVCRNREAFSEQYGKDIPAVGNFRGRLSHQGETIELSNAKKEVVDSVVYSDGGNWPTGADGYSPSLERICPDAPSRESGNWAASRLPPIHSPRGTPGRVNDNFSPNLPPSVKSVKFLPACPRPGAEVAVTATVSDDDGVESVILLFWTVRSGRESKPAGRPMERISGGATRGTYRAVIEGQPAESLVRFQIQAADAAGTKRLHPAESEPCWTHSTFVLSPQKAGIAQGWVVHIRDTEEPSPGRRSFRSPSRASQTRGGAAFIYLPPGETEYLTFDHVSIPPRKGGFKVRFHKSQTLKGMKTVNIIFEGVPRYVLSEALSYEVYRMAGVPAELTEFIRIQVDGRQLGYHLLIEQPNRSFLRRNGRNPDGNLYKLLWYGGGIVGKHEKKTNIHTGHDDLLALIQGLNEKSGTAQWEYIQEHFNVDEVASYFAVNMCISNWDGFHNNYFTYHETGGAEKWEIYPWDEDKTWGAYDGASPPYDFYEMPLTMGMNGDRPTGGGRGRGWGGSWWRPGGYFSGPLLANPHFRKRFLRRLKEICLTLFTEEVFYPIMDRMERRLEPEIRLQAEAREAQSQYALQEFRMNMQSFRNQVKYRRRFILSQREIRELGE